MNQVVGTTLFYLSGSPYYTHEMLSRGLAATFSVDVTQFALVGATSVTFQVQSRANDETSFTNVGAAASALGSGVVSWDVTGVNEVVRVEVAFAGGSPSASDAIHFLLQPIAWRPY